MKKIILLFLAGALSIFLTGCAGQMSESAENTSTVASESKSTPLSEPTHTPVTIKTSTDKHTWYIKDYVGKNCASLGYTSLGGDRLDKYGNALLNLVFITADGSYVDIQEEDVLKEYVVVSQNIQPNSEMNLAFQKDEDGSEYDYLIESQCYDEIVLYVKKIGENSKNDVKLTEIQAAPDKYTRYIADYVGRNLAACGYTSIAGDRRVKYGEANLKLVIVTEDGSLVDVGDGEALKQYVVTNQNIAPNTELKISYMKDSNGNEYSSLTESQNIEEIELYVKKLS